MDLDSAFISGVDLEVKTTLNVASVDNLTSSASVLKCWLVVNSDINFLSSGNVINRGDSEDKVVFGINSEADVAVVVNR